MCCWLRCPAASLPGNADDGAAAAMSTIGDLVAWFGDSDNWQGHTGVPSRVAEHLRYSVSAVAGAVIVTVPIAAFLGHKRRFGTLAINIANIGQTLPSFAILVLLVQLL